MKKTKLFKDNPLPLIGYMFHVEQNFTKKEERITFLTLQAKKLQKKQLPHLKEVAFYTKKTRICVH